MLAKNVSPRKRNQLISWILAWAILVPVSFTKHSACPICSLILLLALFIGIWMLDQMNACEEYKQNTSSLSASNILVLFDLIGYTFPRQFKVPWL